MHRSGTSLTTRVLMELGLDLGSNGSLIPPDEVDNPRGYWEQRVFVELDDELLKALGGHASDLPVLDSGWQHDPALAELRERAGALIDRTFDREPFGWKDPRASLLLPFWRGVAEDLRVVICVRNPAEVADSMRRRHPDGYPREHWFRQWARHTHDALRDSVGADRVVVVYEDLLDHPQREIARLGQFLNGRTSERDEVAAAAALVDTNLRRNRVSDNELFTGPQIPEDIAQAYVELREAVRAGDSLDPVAARLADVSAEPPAPPKRTPSRQMVVGVLLVRNEVDVVRLCVVHHLASACDRILAIDNGSTDGTREALNRLANRLPLEWTADDGPYAQHELVTGLAEEARLAGADWVLPLDADEFWVGPTDLRDHLAQFGEAGAVRVPRVEFIQKRSRRKRVPRAVLDMTVRVEQPNPEIEMIEKFRERRASVFELAPAPKLALRAAAGLQIKRGAHDATGIAGPVVDATDMTILHAPLRSRPDLDRKAEQGRRLVDAGSAFGEGVQSKFWAAEAREGRLEEAWRASAANDGALDVYGRRVELVEDDRLKNVLQPWTRGATSQLAARLLGRSF